MILINKLGLQNEEALMMSAIQCKQITVWLAVLLLFAVETTFAQNIPTTAITNSTTASPMSVEKHNALLCYEVDSDYRQACRNVMTRLSASTRHKYHSVELHKEWWLGTPVMAEKPDTVHIIYGDLTLAAPISITADNVAIMGNGKPYLKLAYLLRTIGVHAIIDSKGNKAYIEGLKIKPVASLWGEHVIPVNHFIHIKGGSAIIKNVSLLEAETSEKTIILAEAGTDASDSPSLDLTDIDITGEDGKAHSLALKTSGFKSINLQKIRTHHFTPDCAFFLFENASSIKLNSIQSHIDNLIAPNVSGAIAIYTQPSSDIQLALKDVNFSYRVTTPQPQVIIAAKHDISGHLSLAGKNSFDRFSIRSPTGLVVSTNPEEVPSKLTSTESTFAGTTPAIPEYWWSDLPVCASEAYEAYKEPSSSISTTEWYGTTTPYLEGSPTPTPTPTTTTTTTTITDPEGTSITPSTKRPTAGIISSTLKTEAAIWLSPSTTNTSSAVKSSSAFFPSTNHSIKTTPISVAENRDPEESGSDNLKYLAVLAAIPAAYAGAIGGCVQFKLKPACIAANYMLFGLPQHYRWAWYVWNKGGLDYSVELSDVISRDSSSDSSGDKRYLME